MEAGSKELARSAVAYMVSIAFCVTFLLANVWGASTGTALSRAVIVAFVTLFVSRLLIKPVVDVVLDAMARDQAKQAEEDD